MTELRPGTKLRRASDIHLRLDSADQVHVEVDGGSLHTGPHTLSVLEAFAQPSPFGEIVDRLRSRVRGVQDWMDLTSTIVQLYRAGVLVEEGTQRSSFGRTGFAAAGIQLKMLNDRRRTATYLAAIGEVVKPGDVVVDIGTGTGVLAVAAAKAGARHVYAIEASQVGRVAQEVFSANGLADRITLVEGWSTQLALPEPADVLLSELIGNEPLAEKVLEVTLDAAKRMLKPDARLLPSALRIFGLPVAVPRASLTRIMPCPANVRDWRSWYDIDFTPLVEAARAAPLLITPRSGTARRWKSFSEPVLLAEVDFRATKDLVIDNSATVPVTAAGRVGGLLIYFELQLGPTTVLSTHPVQVDQRNSWRSAVWVLKRPISVALGDRLAVSYRYRTANAGVSLVRA